MALTPEDIEQHIFKVSRRGYDKVESASNVAPATMTATWS